jgi:predicted nucleic acid-binding protein
LILWDTGALLAAINDRDPLYPACVALLRNTRPPLLVPAPVIVEIGYFLQERVGPHAEAAFLRSITAGHIQLLHPEHADLERAADLVERYADFPLGTVDACVMAIAERLNITKIATVDRRHFHAVKLRHCDGLELLPT